MAPETAEAQGLSAELKTPCIMEVVKGRKAKKGDWAMVDANQRDGRSDAATTKLASQRRGRHHVERGGLGGRTVGQSAH